MKPTGRSSATLANWIVCSRPRRGTSRNPADSAPATDPTVLTAYTTLSRGVWESGPSESASAIGNAAPSVAASGVTRSAAPSHWLMRPAAGASDAIKAARVLPSSGPPVCADAQVAAAAAAVSVKASGSAGYPNTCQDPCPCHGAGGESTDEGRQRRGKGIGGWPNHHGERPRPRDLGTRTSRTP